MINSVESQLQAKGVAQVLVILEPGPAEKVGKPMLELVAAIPVKRSRSSPTVPSTLVKQLSQHFHVSQASPDSAIAAKMQHLNLRSAGATWFAKAKATEDPTPAARYFPNLNVMLGTVDRAGATALDNHSSVKNVVSAPPLELIRPVETEATARPLALAAKPKSARAWGIDRIRANELHERKITGKGVIVGHLDTGVDGRHPALRDAVGEFAKFDDLGFQVASNPKPHDSGKHGTHTAGTIAGRATNGQAIGVAPGCKLASALVIEGGNAIARVLAGMDWIVGRRARILAMSLGFPGYLEDFLPLTRLLRDRGVLPVFAVGNERMGTSRSPGNYVEALSVGAMDQNDQVARFSSSQGFENWTVPDVVAPGVGVVSAQPGGGYEEMNGSSMATPHIAGLAALLWEAVPTATLDQVEAAIFDSCQALAGAPPERQGKGIPDAVQALSLLQGGRPRGAGRSTKPRRRVSTKKSAKKSAKPIGKKSTKKKSVKKSKMAKRSVKTTKKKAAKTTKQKKRGRSG